MDSHKSDQGFRESKEIRKLLKLKDSKVGNVILKSNVFEQAKLGNKLDKISHHQRSQEVNLSWKKHLLLRKQRSTLLKSKSTSSIMIPPSQLPRLLPPIKMKPNTFSHQQIGTGLTGHTEEDRFHSKRHGVPMDTSGTEASGELREKNLCPKTKSSEKALLQWKRAIKKTRERIQKSKRKLPPLVLQKSQLDYEKDPRFARLIEQLVPNMSRRISDGDIRHKNEDVDDDEEDTDISHENGDHEDEQYFTM